MLMDGVGKTDIAMWLQRPEASLHTSVLHTLLSQVQSHFTTHCRIKTECMLSNVAFVVIVEAYQTVQVIFQNWTQRLEWFSESNQPRHQMQPPEKVCEKHYRMCCCLLSCVVCHFLRTLYRKCFHVFVQVLNLLLDLDPDFDFIGKRYINVLQVCCHLVAMSSACYNPFIYASLHSKVRMHLKGYLCPCRNRHRGMVGRATSRSWSMNGTAVTAPGMPTPSLPSL